MIDFAPDPMKMLSVNGSEVGKEEQLNYSSGREFGNLWAFH